MGDETTGRFIITFAPGAGSAARVLDEMHRRGGVAPAAMSLAAGEPAPSATGVLSEKLGVGVVSLAPDARASLGASQIVRVRPERWFKLPKTFAPKPPKRRKRIGPGLGVAPAPGPDELEDTNEAFGAVGIAAGQPTGKGVKVAVLDSGIWLDHPDFIERKGDIKTMSFIENDDTVSDRIGHGTFVAGIIAGPLVPKEGFRYGVAPDVELHVGRVIRNDGRAREHDVIQGISWALDNHCRLISISVGAPPATEADADYEKIAARAIETGALIIAAAGNDSRRPSSKAPVCVPANSTRIVAVAAASAKGFPTPDSNAGKFADNGGAIDLSAPGIEVYSSCAPDTIPYGIEGGTSVATPFVTGIAAQHLERDPTLTPDALWIRLVASARAADLQLLNTTAEDVGAGMVQAFHD
jgi:subtilisin